MSSSNTNSDVKDIDVSTEADVTAVSDASATTESHQRLSSSSAAVPSAPSSQVPSSSSAAPSSPASPPPSRKVKVHFVPVGSAPILKKTKFQISADQRFASVHTFLRKLLKMSSTNVGATPPPPLFLYLTSAFCPSPEEIVGELEECFSKRGELIVHYSLQEAWG